MNFVQINKYLQESKTKFPIYGLIILIIAFVISTILLGSVPPVDRDALTHHLFIPKLYLNHGGIYEIPEIPFSYYPMNLDLLYMIPLYFGYDIIPKYIHFLFALLTAILVYNYLKSSTSLIYTLLGVLFFLSIPIIVRLSISAYVDLGLMFFSTASLLLIFRWLNCDYKIRYLILAGICCGLAAGIKYNGILTMIILALMIPLLYIRSKKHAPGVERKSIGYCSLFIVIALLAFSPWLVRNFVWTGNPIYPMHDSFFNPSRSLALAATENNAISTENSTITDNPFVSRKILYKETWWQTLLLPVRFFFEGQDDNPQFFDGKLNPFLLFLPLLAFSRKSSSSSLYREKQSLLIFAVLFFFFTFFQQVTRIRYIICIIPPLVILSIFGLQNLFAFFSEIHSSTIKKYGKIFVFVIPIAIFVYNFEYIIKQYQIVQPLAYLSEKISKDQYINHFRPEYSAIQFINKLPQKKTKTLAIFLGNRGYYFDGSVIFDLKESKSLFFEMVKNAEADDQISEKLKTLNISHLLIRYDLFQQWIQQHLNPEERKRLNLFFQNKTKLTYEANSHGVFQLL